MPLGHVQIESSATATRSGDEREHVLGDTQIRVPLSREAEVRVNMPPYRIERDGARSAGWDDSGVEARVVLSKTKKVATAVTLFSTLPTGSRSTAERRFQPGAVLAANFSLSPRAELVVNVGGERPTRDQQRFSRAITSASLRFDTSKRLNLFSEVYFLSRDEPNGPNQKFVAAGAMYLASRRTAFYARVGSGLGNHIGGLDYFYALGVAQWF
ncbi:hypothetical protein IAD21_00384 [Abditibacteriota bacterium]|nr:hypothetical protein IAD21_00384 [Abditibacteriota bacterium]